VRLEFGGGCHSLPLFCLCSARFPKPAPAFQNPLGGVVLAIGPAKLPEHHKPFRISSYKQNEP
jgi:hypothetical protein